MLALLGNGVFMLLGDAVFFHCNLLHTSSANVSDDVCVAR